MDDQPELNQPAVETIPRFAEALSFLGENLKPAWQAADAEAIKSQTTRWWVALFAIVPGIAAIVAAIGQLMLTELLPALKPHATIFEVIAVLVAAAAVIVGLRLGTHHRWLTRRQSAERLRNLKFTSLGWHELWCDMKAWKDRVKREIVKLQDLNDHDAEVWATEEDNATPDRIVDPKCSADPTELNALAAYYIAKRLSYQQSYFRRQSKKAESNSWSVRWKVGLIAFFASLGIVLLHAGLEVLAPRHDASHQSHNAFEDHAEHHREGGLPVSSLTDNAHLAPEKSGLSSPNHGTASKATADIGKQDAHEEHSLMHKFEVLLVGLAAMIPVLAFGIRAWTSAFEHPRSRNLFRAKANALTEPIELMKRDSSDLLETMQHITNTEHFFMGEHREWCRLQLESEWYV